MWNCSNSSRGATRKPLRRCSVDIPPVVATIFPFGVAVAMAGYYLVWKYLVGFLNELVEIGS
jgi:hypothetical protein